MGTKAHKMQTAKLAKRQAIIALGVSLSLGAIMAFIQVCADYLSQEEAIEVQLQQLITSSSASAAESIWGLDKDLAASVASGILSHPLISRVNISTSNNVVMSDLKQNVPPQGWVSERLTFLFGANQVRKIPLHHDEDITNRPVGVLHLTVDPQNVREEFVERVVLVLLFGLAKALALGFALFTLFYYSLTKPIERYAQWIKTIDPKRPSGWGAPPPERNVHDELRSLGEEAASRFKQAKAYFIELQEKRADLIKLNKDLESRVAQRTSELESILIKTEQLANTDELTGLANRRSFWNQAQIKHTEWKRYKRGYSILMLDVDHFKNINDAFGHDVGDAVLMKVARVLIESTRLENIVGRIGGEEFCILMIGDDEAEALNFAERIRRTLQGTSTKVNGHTIEVTVSIGLVTPSYLEDRFDSGLKRADMMLYKAKSYGRNQVCVYSPNS